MILRGHTRVALHPNYKRSKDLVNQDYNKFRKLLNVNKELLVRSPDLVVTALKGQQRFIDNVGRYILAKENLSIKDKKSEVESLFKQDMEVLQAVNLDDDLTESSARKAFSLLDKYFDKQSVMGELLYTSRDTMPKFAKARLSSGTLNRLADTLYKQQPRL